MTDYRSHHNQTLSDAATVARTRPDTPCVYCGKTVERHYKDEVRIPGVVIYTCKVKQLKGVPCVACKEAKESK